MRVNGKRKKNYLQSMMASKFCTNTCSFAKSRTKSFYLYTLYMSIYKWNTDRTQSQTKYVLYTSSHRIEISKNHTIIKKFANTENTVYIRMYIAF